MGAPGGVWYDIGGEEDVRGRVRTGVVLARIPW